MILGLKAGALTLSRVTEQSLCSSTVVKLLATMLSMSGNTGPTSSRICFCIMCCQHSLESIAPCNLLLVKACMQCTPSDCALQMVMLFQTLDVALEPSNKRSMYIVLCIYCLRISSEYVYCKQQSADLSQLTNIVFLH